MHPLSSGPNPTTRKGPLSLSIMVTEIDEPLTPAGRLFLRPELNTIITCAIGLKNPIEVDAVESQIRNSMLIEHPRFCSLMIKDRHGREHWRRTQVNLDQHIIVRHESDGDTAADDEEAVNDYLADLSLSSPLSADKPLWEIHLLMSQKCAIFRVHHALGDGISLMSMFLSCCRKADDPTQPATVNSGDSSSTSSRRNGREWKVWRLVKMLWYTLIFVFEFGLRSLWLKDKKTAVIGGAGVELWPRKLATAKFHLDDMKAVKKAVPHAVNLILML
ncbi:unnamed protein product [Ilex paraguariensis]|uniref:diacylglycerol O-acyltransferase n=1 Tax=Ilex paraguariensis TaxID=185542 RepID=A0ABC8R783_9AQUA